MIRCGIVLYSGVNTEWNSASQKDGAPWSFWDECDVDEVALVEVDILS